MSRIAPTKEAPLRVVVDTREQAPWTFSHPLLAGLVVIERGTLTTGDYSPAEARSVAVERKSLDDFLGSITSGRDRFEREIERGGLGLDFFWVVIEASVPDVLLHRYRSRMAPWAVLQTVGSWSTRYGVPFLFAGDRPAAEVLSYTLLRWAASRLTAGDERIADADRVAQEAADLDWSGLPF